MVGKTAPIRKHDAQRMDTIAKHCGCLPCLLMGFSDVHTTIEHVTERGRRVGDEEQHQWTIGLCVWHHFGRPLPQWESMPGRVGGPLQATSGALGPSLIWGRTTFEEHFGDEVNVLVPVQDFMLAQFDEAPWPEYSVPRQVARAVRNHWIELNALPARPSVHS